MANLPLIRAIYKSLRKFFLRYGLFIFVLLFIVATIAFIAYNAFKTTEPTPLTIKHIPAVLVSETTTTVPAEVKEVEQPIVATTTLPPTTTTTPPAPVLTSGSKHDWLLASGISQDVWPLVDYLVSRESGWNPNAVNKSSGACGLGQQLPCGKWPHQWNDPIGGLIDMNSYVVGRYGSWQNAVNHSKNVGWY